MPLNPATSAPGLASPLPHLHRDSALPCHICTGTRLSPATSAPGLGSPLPHLHRDLPHLHRDLAGLPAASPAFRKVGSAVRHCARRRFYGAGRTRSFRSTSCRRSRCARVTGQLGRYFTHTSVHHGPARTLAPSCSSVRVAPSSVQRERVAVRRWYAWGGAQSRHVCAGAEA